MCKILDRKTIELIWGLGLNCISSESIYVCFWKETVDIGNPGQFNVAKKKKSTVNSWDNLKLIFSPCEGWSISVSLLLLGCDLLGPLPTAQGDF